MRATPRRSLLLAGLTVTASFLLLPARPALGALAVEATWRSPGAGATVSGSVTVDLDIGFDLDDVYRVRRWRVRLVDGPDTMGLCSRTLSPSQRRAVVSVTWDSRYEPGGACTDDVVEASDRPLDNGTYTIEVTVWDHVTNTDGNAGTVSRSVVVDNAPAAPAGVDAEFDEGRQAIDLSWQANGEGDLTGYRIQQCHTAAEGEPCDGRWSEVATPGTGTTAAAVPVDEPGAYRYRVQARRASGSGSGEHVSPWSNADEPVFLEAADGGDCAGGCTTTTKPTSEADEDEDSCRRGCTTGSTDPGTESGPDGTSGTGDGTGGTAAGAVDGGPGREQRRSLPPRLVRRASTEEGYREKLPYGKALPSGDEGPLSLVTEGGAGMALVPVAGGALAIVFAFQMRYLTRRAEDVSPLDA